MSKTSLATLSTYAGGHIFWRRDIVRAIYDAYGFANKGGAITYTAMPGPGNERGWPALNTRGSILNRLEKKGWHDLAGPVGRTTFKIGKVLYTVSVLDGDIKATVERIDGEAKS